jgi:hypothetical protein
MYILLRSAVYTLTVVTNAQTLTATATLTPAAVTGFFSKLFLVQRINVDHSNTTGIFTGLSVGINLYHKSIH